MIRSAAAAACLVALLNTRSRPIALRVIDTKGIETTVSGATVDYGSLLTSDATTDGIRVVRGDAEIFLKWADLDTLKAVRATDSTSRSRVEFDVLLRSGRRSRVGLLRKGRMKLTGIADLGAYSIELDSVRMIVPDR
jgi:hypothetical protein